MATELSPLKTPTSEPASEPASEPVSEPVSGSANNESNVLKFHHYGKPVPMVMQITTNNDLHSVLEGLVRNERFHPHTVIEYKNSGKTTLLYIVIKLFEQTKDGRYYVMIDDLLKKGANPLFDPNDTNNTSNFGNCSPFVVVMTDFCMNVPYPNKLSPAQSIVELLLSYVKNRPKSEFVNSIIKFYENYKKNLSEMEQILNVLIESNHTNKNYEERIGDNLTLHSLCTHIESSEDFDSIVKNYPYDINAPIDSSNSSNSSNLTTIHAITFMASMSNSSDEKSQIRKAELIKRLTSLINHPDANLNVVDESGSTPLHFAARFGSPDIVELLLATKKCDTSLLMTIGERKYTALDASQQLRFENDKQQIKELFEKYGVKNNSN